jgi:hypothetical protein
MSKRILKKDLEATIERLQRDRQMAVEVLKSIALTRSLNPKMDAHQVLRAMGLLPLGVDPNCPPNAIYFVPNGTSIKVTDYL